MSLSINCFKTDYHIYYSPFNYYRNGQKIERVLLCRTAKIQSMKIRVRYQPRMSPIMPWICPSLSSLFLSLCYCYCYCYCTSYASFVSSFDFCHRQFFVYLIQLWKKLLRAFVRKVNSYTWRVGAGTLLTTKSFIILLKTHCKLFINLLQKLDGLLRTDILYHDHSSVSCGGFKNFNFTG